MHMRTARPGSDCAHARSLIRSFGVRLQKHYILMNILNDGKHENQDAQKRTSICVAAFHFLQKKKKKKKKKKKYIYIYIYI